MWSISTYNIPTLHTFEAAEEFWNKTAPWKNKDESWRPLDSVRMDHKRLVKTKDGGYACVLYNTALVTYYPDKVELELDSRASSSAFCWKVYPAGCSITSANGTPFWGIDTPEGNRFYTYSKTALILSKQPKNQWKLESVPDKPTEWVFDRKLGAQARKLLKPYRTWYETTERLGVKLRSSWHSVGAIGKSLDMLINQPEGINFLEVSELIGSPAFALKEMYIHIGAHTKHNVPFDRLPRKIKL